MHGKKTASHHRRMVIGGIMSNEAKTHPSDEGREAYMEGLPLSASPYPDDSEQAVEWEGGWIEAEEDDAD